MLPTSSRAGRNPTKQWKRECVARGWAIGIRQGIERMATQVAAASDAWRAAASEYWRESRRPLASLAMVLPLLLLYEGGVVVLGEQAVRNGADVWLRQFLDQLGLSQYFLLPALTIGLLLAWHHTTHDRWKLSAGVVYVMGAECAVLGFVLLVVGRLQAWAVQQQWLPLAETHWALAERGRIAGRLLGFMGAGVYEEMLFRLLLLPVVAFLMVRLLSAQGAAVAATVILTSLIFSAAHYLGPYGDVWTAFSFCFRFAAGAFFAVLFVYRGFGIAAGTHALYDIYVGFG